MLFKTSLIVLALTGCSLLCSGALYARQNSTSETVVQESDTTRIVRKLRFTGNESVRNQTLRGLIRTQTNRELLGITRFAPWYYLWQVTGRFGEPPSYLDRSVVANDMERIQLYYENIGFRNTSVDTTIVEYRPEKVEVTFLIDEGPASRIRSVAYSGVPDFTSPSTRDQFFEENSFSQTALNDTTFLTDFRFNAQRLLVERERIVNYLKNNGYAAVQRDSVVANVRPDPANPLMLDVLFVISSGEIYRFGDVNIRLAGSEGEPGYEETRVITTEPAVNEGNSITLQKQPSTQTRFELLSNQILFKPGDIFNNSLYLNSVTEFQNLGMLSIRGFGLGEEGSLPDFSGPGIPVYFDLQTLPKHSVRAELFGMRRYGFGTGIGLNYTNNNLFGRAENLTIGLNTNLEFVTSSTLRDISPDDMNQDESVNAQVFQSYEARIDYALPRLNFPFASLDRRPGFTNARTIYSLTYSQSDQLYFDINSDIRFNLRYEINHSDRFSSFLDLVELDIIDTDPSSAFRQNLIDEFGEDSFEYQRIVEDFRPQFSSLIRYSFRNQNTNFIKRNFGYFSEYSISVGGNIPYLMDRYLISPGEINGTLPSPLGFSSNELTYSQFIKVSLDYRRYIPLGTEAVFAYRAFAGYAHPYNKSESIALSRRFFAGGSNDIRGWAPFRLGPGEIRPEEVTINGGEIKLAAFTEVRQMMFQDILSADWYLAWHTDAGNVWYGPQNNFRDENNVDILEDGKFFFDRFYKQIAVASGFGIRMDWEYLVARFDFTFRVHDLQMGWFKNRNLYFSFGIGHSF